MLPHNHPEHRKAQGLLGHFDPASARVHEHSRMTTRLTADAPSRAVTSQTSSGSDAPHFSDSSLTGDDDDASDNENYRGQESSRKSARLAAGNKNLTQSKLPFSPKKLRGDRNWRKRIVSDSEDDLGGYGQVDSDVEIVAPPRRSTRSRRTARVNLIDDAESEGDSYHDSPGQKSGDRGAGKKHRKKRPAATRPAYGHFRDVGDLDFDFFEDEATSSLRAHRDVCEKCHKSPAHEELKVFKKGRRRPKVAEDESDDDEDRIRSLGGWVQWFGFLKLFTFVLLT